MIDTRSMMYELYQTFMPDEKTLANMDMYQREITLKACNAKLLHVIMGMIMGTNLTAEKIKVLQDIIEAKK